MILMPLEDLRWLNAQGIETTNLTLEEANELDGLYFRMCTDLPFGREAEARMVELEKKAREPNLKRPLVVNLFAGPGAGKSTTAAKLFAELKDRGVNVELAGEYAKDLTWARRFGTLADQIYVFGKQHHRIFRLVQDCDVIITDSPILMGLAYAADYPTCYTETVSWAFNRYRNLNFLIERTKPYNPKGRNQTLDEAKQKDFEILQLLSRYKVPFKRIRDAQIEQIVEQVVNAI